MGAASGAKEAGPGVALVAGEDGRAAIDCHCHLVPPWLRARNSRAWRDPWFAACHEGEHPRFAGGPEVVDALDQARLGQAVVFGWPFADPALLCEVNDYVAAEVAAASGRLVGFATVNPADHRAEAEMQRARELGLVGLGELNCDAQGFGLSWEGGLRSLLMACEELDWPVLLHASEPVGHAYPGKGGATPGRLWKLLEPMLQEAPTLRLCLAHLGGGLPFYAHMAEVGRVCRQLWFDTAAIPFLYEAPVLGQLASLLGPGRICFGSDFPLLRPTRFRAHFESLPEVELASLMGRAARSWLGRV